MNASERAGRSFPWIASLSGFLRPLVAAPGNQAVALTVTGLRPGATVLASCGCLLLLLLGVSQEASAQAASEYAGATAAAAATAVKTTTPATPAAGRVAGKKTVFLHLPARTESKEDVEERNRRALEQSAGEDGARLLLRSVPSKARVWVNGKLVGSTPLLLILAPGTYRVAMGDESLGTAKQGVSLLPKETQETALALVPRYRRQVRLR